MSVPSSSVPSSPVDPHAVPSAERGASTQRLRRLIFGPPLRTEHAAHALLPKVLALPVFASDAISSVAYATQQIILVLGAAGMWVMEQRGAYTRDTLLLSG